MSESTERMFFELVKAGLFPVHGEGGMDHGPFSDDVDWGEVYRLAEEQSVIGLVADGIDRFKFQVSGFKIPQEWALQFVGQALQLEQRNKAMNQFIARLVSDMRSGGIYALLVKGQGVAQCYEKPLWRACGDVDFFLSDENYKKAKVFLIPHASSVEPEGVYGRHLGMTIDGWVVELHGCLRCGFSGRADRVLAEIQNETFYGGSVSSVTFNANLSLDVNFNESGVSQGPASVQVFKLSKENEVFYVFAHFLGHFYKGGIGLRQICDWCRLLWAYRNELDYGKLESLIRRAGLVSEWKAFGTSAVEYLGMPIEAMPLINLNDNLNLDYNFAQKYYLSLNGRLEKKAERIMNFILEVGNFGHNRDMSFYREGSYLGQKVRSFVRRLGDLWNHLMIFPMDTLRFFPWIVWNGICSAVRGE